ncbi:MAG TPA: hypothetical protein DCY80_01575 [Solibacterales bacterium]|nr:hypothetical protein [Bryobacterales bacterium]
MPRFLLLFAALLMPVFALQPPPAPEEPPIPAIEVDRQWAGTVTTVAPAEGRFRMQSGEGEIEVIAGTSFNPGWSIGNLQAGLNVVVSGVVEPDGTVRARSVSVIAESPEQS